MSDKKPKMRWYWFGVNLCRVFRRLFLRVYVSGRENVPAGGSFLLICNHQSFFDPVFCGTAMKRHLHYLARDTLFRNKIFGLMLHSINTIPVRRGHADITAMRIVIQKLNEGNGVCLFPEATRTRDGKIAEFKPGFGLLCRRGNAAVVPVLIDGAFECWPRHRIVFTPWSRIVIQFGKCIPADEAKHMTDKELAKKLTDTLRKMQSDCRIKYGNQPLEY